MSIPRPPMTTAPLGRYSTSSNRPTFEDLNPRHSFQATPHYESDMDYRRSSFGPAPRPHSYHPQVHQDFPRHPVVVQGAPPPVTRYVCFQKRPSGRPWKNEWETCDHITMSISPEETEKQIRKHDEPGRDIGTCISKLGKYQLRHLRKQEDKLNKSEKDTKNYKWVISAVGKEKKQGGGTSQTFWAIYSRQPKYRPTTATTSGRPPLPGRSQTYTHHSTAPIRREEQPYDGPIVVQSVEIPAPPRSSSFIGGRPASFSGGRPATSGGYYGGEFMTSTGPPQVQDVNPVRQGFPTFSAPGPQLREVDGRSSSFTRAQLLSQAADAFPKAATRPPLGVEAQGFGYQQPHSAEPRASMPPITRTQSTRVDQPFQAEQPSKRSPRHGEARQSRRTHQTPPQERHRRSSSMAAPRVRQTEHYQDRTSPPEENRKSMNRRSPALDLPEVYPEEKMNRTDRWVESSISGSSGLGTSTVGSGDGGSVVGEYVLNPPPMGKRRNSVSTYAGKDYYQNTSGNRRSMAAEYYLDSKPALEIQMQYETTPQHRGRAEPKYVGYHGMGRKRSPSRRRSRYGGPEDGDYEYESADESMQEQMRNLRVDSSPSTRRGPSRPQYRRYRGLVEYGRS